MRSKKPRLDAQTVRAQAELAEALLTKIALSPDEAGIVAECSASHIRRAVQAGDLKATKIGSLWRIRPADLLVWLTSETPPSVIRRVS